QHAGQLVVGLQISRIDKTDPQLAIDLIEHDGAETPRLRFGQQADQPRFRIEMLEIDKRDAQLLGERLRNRIFRNKGTFDDNTAELAATAFLFVECELE